MNATRQGKSQHGQKAGCADPSQTKPVFPILCITALKRNESKRQGERGIE